MSIRCIIVDDEPLAREGLERLVREAGFLDLTGQCSSAMEANQVLATQAVDLMFLDIQMPRMRGLDFLRTLTKRPLVILTTAYPEHALEGFDLQVLDYLLKPITPERFLQAVNRAREALAGRGAETGGGPGAGERSTPPPSPPKEQGGEPYFFIKSGTGFEKIFFDELLYVEAAQNYCALHTNRGKFLTLSTIHALEARLPQDRFLRVQKSYIVSVEKISSLSTAEVVIREHRIPVGKNYRDALLAFVDKGLLKP
jgi:DNA-binding LytR/AlgR family response regulator